MGVTIKDIAKKCGISITTVSLVLNHKGEHISKETKNKIYKAVEELNYQPNQVAVSMVTKRTNTIGLILPDISDLFYSSFAKEIERKFSEKNYNVIYGNTLSCFDTCMEYLHIFQKRNVDTIVIVYPDYAMTEAQKKRLNSFFDFSNTPVLWIDHGLLRKEESVVSVNQKMGGCLAVKHLIELGHTRIGCICGPHDSKISQERLKGYKETLNNAGISYDSQLVYHGEFDIESGSRGIEELLKYGITAVFACNDMMALGVYVQSRKMNFQIPEQLSVVGFDNVYLTGALEPPLTTIVQPIDELSEKIVSCALELIKEKRYENVVMNPSLKVRSSTAHPVMIKTQ